MLNHPPKLNEEHDPFKVYNIGNNHPVRLMKFIEILEDAIGRKAEKEYLPMQMGDVYQTYADIDDLERFRIPSVDHLGGGTCRIRQVV